MSAFEIQFQPDGIRISVPAGTTVSEAMKTAGISIQLPCGGTGRCGKCGVEIHPGAPEPSAFDRRHIAEDDLERGVRLACRTRIDRPMSVLISPSLRVLDGNILVDGINRIFRVESCVTKTLATLPDDVTDLSQLSKSLGMSDGLNPDSIIDLLQELPAMLCDSGHTITVVRHSGRIIAVEPGDTTSRCYGIACDIGTTTVVGTILDLATGDEIAHASRLNTQIVYGEDTISRIKYAIEHEGGRDELREKIREVVNEIIAEAAASAGIDSTEIYEAMIAGNTTMSHLFLGLDPEGLSRIPFEPVTCEQVNQRTSEAGIDINPCGNVAVLPNIAGFVGSDTVAVMLACDFLEDGPTQLAVDVGTNGELALRHNGTLTVCSTAAGPALEGATLTCGMRAAAGAIEHVHIGASGIDIDVIGDMTPIGICGSGIIDLAAELLRVGVIDKNGRMLEGKELPDTVHEDIRSRIVTVDNQPAFLIHRSGSADVDNVRDVVLTQRDVRQIQLAKGAIRTGINLLVAEAGITVDDLTEILLAGAFGNYISKAAAVSIGLLPDIPLDRIRFVGNAASTGAKMALLSCGARIDADRIRQVTGHIELAAQPTFMDEFMNAMIFPMEQS